MDSEIKKGKWKHFKGGVYDVLGVAKHSETMEEFVVYEHDGVMWIRPKAMYYICSGKPARKRAKQFLMSILLTLAMSVL